MTKLLKQQSNSELNIHIKSLAQKEREFLSEILEVIKEIDLRKMYLEMGFSSLFSYLTEHIGYSAASAQRRIDGARLLRQIPEVSEKIESGELKLNQISLVQKEIREFEKTNTKKLSRDEKLELLTLVEDKTYEQSQKIVAQYLDKPIQEFTKLRTQQDESVRIELTLSKEQFEKLKLAQDLISHAEPAGNLGKFIEYVSSKIIQQKLGTKRTSRGAASTVEVNGESNSEMEMNGDSKSEVELNGKRNSDNELIKNTMLNKSNKIDISTISTISNISCNSFSHVTFSEDSFSNMKYKYTENGASQKNVIDVRLTRPKKAKNSLSAAAKNNFSASIKKNVLRSQQCCQYEDPKSGKKCGSTKFLQIDHIHSKWAKGSHQIENAQVLCSNHNKFKYRKEAGLMPC